MPWPEGGICTADGWKLLACADVVLCKKLMNEIAHVALAVDVYFDKIRHLIEPRAAAPRRAHRTNLLLPPQHQKRVEAPGTHQDG